MSGDRISLLFSNLLCGAVTCIVACNPQTGSGPATGTRAAALDACNVAAADGEWTSQALTRQTGAFAVELSATPSESPTDAVIGLSAGEASWFPQLAAVVRFNPDGMIDVRAGSGYQADVAFPYTAGTHYPIHVELNVALHVYSVAVLDPAGGWKWLARSYPFRTEQADVAQIDNVATFVDSDSGALEVCNVRTTNVDLPFCPGAVAGGGFLDQVIGPPGEILVSSDVMLGADQTLDGVFGQSPNPPTNFDSLATAVRFSPDGVLDARNGASYQADVAMPYLPGVAKRVLIIANIPRRTYSAYVAVGDATSVQIAHNYSFRTSQLGARFLGHGDAIVDSTAGRLAVCNARHLGSVGVRSLRDGNYSVAPITAGHHAVISDGTTTTMVVDSVGSPVVQAPIGGQVAADPVGRVYVAHISGGDLTVDALSPGLTPRWTRGIPVGSDHRIVAIGADAASVVVGVGPTTGGIDMVKRWLVDGTDSTTQTGALGDAMAIGPAGYAIGSAIDGTVSVAKWSFGQDAPDWQRSWQNPAVIDGIALTDSGGVYFGGRFTGPINFDGPTLQPGALGSVYVVGLTSAGAQLYTTDIHQSSLASIASNGSLTVISAGSGRRELVMLLTDGHVFLPENETETTFNDFGKAGSIAIDADNRIYWNFTMAWPSATHYPFLISIDPPRG